MKQIEKLQAIIATPRIYGLSKNSRAYGMICEIAKKVSCARVSSGAVASGSRPKRGRSFTEGGGRLPLV